MSSSREKAFIDLFSTEVSIRPTNTTCLPVVMGVNKVAKKIYYTYIDVLYFKNVVRMWIVFIMNDNIIDNIHPEEGYQLYPSQHSNGAMDSTERGPGLVYF